MEIINNKSIKIHLLTLPTVTKKICSLKCDILGKRYQMTFEPVGAFFYTEPLENHFFECQHTTYVKRAHIGTFNYKSRPENEKKLKSGKVTWGHKNLRSCPKNSPEIFLSWPFTFSIFVNTNWYQKYHQNTGNMKNIFLASTIGTLPILQECPYSRIQIPFLLVVTTQMGHAGLNQVTWGHLMTFSGAKRPDTWLVEASRGIYLLI